MTIQDLVNQAMYALGEMSPGQTASPEESRAALAVLNDIVSGWTTEHRRVYVIDNLQFPMDPGKARYTMGPGGDLNSFRPVKIEKANAVRYEDNDPIGLVKELELVNSTDWAAIEEKGMQAIQPLKLYNDNAYPLLNLHVWPIPVCS